MQAIQKITKTCSVISLQKFTQTIAQLQQNYLKTHLTTDTYLVTR